MALFDAGSRFEVIGPLGSGGAADVVHAVDRLSGRHVAIKRLSADHGEHGDAGVRLADEFAVIRRLRHPDLLAVYDLIGSDDSGASAPLLVSELVEGQPLDDWWAGRALDARLAALARLLGVLDFLHRRAVLHRDIKPSNVLVTDDRPSLKVIDFGLATRLGAASAPAGTLGYVAPEVLAGGAAERASDLYAVGVLLYVALFDALPFSAEQLARGTSLERAVSLPAAASEVAAPLRALVTRLLAREPADRPASAAEALHALVQAGRQAPQAALRALVGEGLPEPLLVGRQRELDRFDAALLALGDDGRGGGYVIAGAAGSGRTRLAHELQTRARLRRLPVRWGLFHGVAPGDESAESVESAGGAESAARAARDFSVDYFCGRAIEHELAALAQAALAAGRLVVIVDGALDALACAVLEAALRDLRHVLVVVFVDEHGAAPHGFERIDLAPLSRAQSDELVASMLPHGWSTAAFEQAAFRASGGSPQLLGELVRLAVQQHLVRLSADQTPTPLSLDADLARALARLEADEGARALAARRAAALPAAAHGALALLSLCPVRGLPLRALSADERDALEPLIVQGLVHEQDGVRLRLAAGALGDALLARLGLEARQQLGRATLALEQRGALELDAAERAQLCVRSGLCAERRDVVRAGARSERARFAVASAITLYEALLADDGGGAGDAPDGDDAAGGRDDGAAAAAERAALARELAELYLVRGEDERARALLLATAERSPAHHRVDLLAALANARLHAGAPAEGLALIDELLVDGDSGDARLAALRAKLLFFAGQLADAAAAARLAQASGDAEARTEALQILGLCSLYQGDLAAADEALRQTVTRAERGDDRLALARALNSLGMVQQRRSQFAEARASYQRCLAIAREVGHLPFQVSFAMNLASVAQQQGDLVAAVAGYRESLQLARRLGRDRETAQVEHNLARLCAELGQLANADAHARRSRELADALGLHALVGYNDVVSAEIACERGEPQQAQAALARGRALFERLDDAVGLADVELVRGRLALIDGDAAAAERCAAAVVERAGEHDTLQIRADWLLGEAALRLSRPDEALSLLRRALRRAEDTGERAVLPELHHLVARALYESGAAAQADVHTVAARRLLEAQLATLTPAQAATFRSVGSRAQILDASSTAASTSSDARSPARAGERAQAELLVALLEVTKQLNAEHDLERLLELIIDHAVDLTGAERGFLLLRPAVGDGALAIRVARNIDQQTIRREAFKISRSVAEEVARSGRPVIAQSALDDERFRGFLSVHQLGLRSILCVPLVVRRALRGAIYLDNRFRTQTFDDSHRELLATFADQAGLALGNRELDQQNRARQRELEAREAELERVNAELEDVLAQKSAHLDELRDLARSQRDELEGRYTFDNIVGHSEVMRRLFALMERVKEIDTPVLIHGESGTGKEVVAKALHYNGHRREGGFVSVNCGAIPTTLLESELFGYVKGAFTGAAREHRGLFERADGGTLFLDEVGDMPPELQVKLLRVLQEKRFARLGGEEELDSDFRLVAASNKDLAELVQRGSFREDLFYRLNVIKLVLPPLRERRADIAALVAFLLERHGGADARLSRGALDRLVAYHWPGNVRELENEVQRLLALGGPDLGVADLSPRIRDSSSKRVAGPHSGGAVGPDATLKQATQALEVAMARDALRREQGNVTRAAARLGITRVGLHKLMKRHGLTRR